MKQKQKKCWKSLKWFRKNSMLKSKGYSMEVIDCVRRWWGEFVDNDCSTTPENWLDKITLGSWSFCHAWSAHPLVQFSEIKLGVRQTAPGWRKVSFDPLLVKGEKVTGTVPTPFGTINVELDWTGTEPISNIQLPPGVQLE
jgi:alpha-L-rhamnosidase